MIELLYFAWVREAIGVDGEILPLPPAVATVGGLLDALAARSPGHAAALADLARDPGRGRSELRRDGRTGARRGRGRDLSAGDRRMIAVRVGLEAFDAATITAALTAGRFDIGAVVTFTGIVRADHDLLSLTLEHYPAMTERALTAIAAEAAARWPLTGGTIVHRVGRLLPGDPIVLVAVAAAHRAAAFDAAAFLMDWLKTKAPFWKREETAAGSSWVVAAAADAAAAARWD